MATPEATRDQSPPPPRPESAPLQIILALSEIEAAGLHEASLDAETQLEFRSVWVSDVHLGMPGCQDVRLLEFLRRVRCDHLYLVGDLIDGWRLRKSWHWPPSHNTVIQKILRMARKGTRVTYIPGNHDEFFRDFVGLTFGDIAIRERAFHRTADGRDFLILHGDEFDGFVRRHRWISIFGSGAYVALMIVNRWLNWIRRRLGLSYWSLSAHLKKRVKDAVAFIARFEESVVREARRHNVNGVICGHIHTPQMRFMDDILYVNDGDWVESCTALVEHHDGRLEILRLAEQTPPPTA